MDTEQQDEDVATTHLQPQPVMCIRATVPVAELTQHQGEWLATLTGYLREHHISAAGPPYVRYHTFGETETDLELGIPVAEPSPGAGRISAGLLPGGPSVTTWHIGPHDALARAYSRLAAWMAARGHEADGAAWEVYTWIDSGADPATTSWPDPSTWHTLLVQPVQGCASHP